MVNWLSRFRWHFWANRDAWNFPARVVVAVLESRKPMTRGQRDDLTAKVRDHRRKWEMKP